jgi:hypothetical protein
MLNKETYRKDLHSALERLSELLRTRNELDVEIAQLRRTIGNLSELVGDDAADSIKFALASGQPQSLPQACRNALRTLTSPASASEIMEAILTMGFDPKDQANLLASVQTTLRRMTQGDDPEVIERINSGKKQYALKSPASTSISGAWITDHGVFEAGLRDAIREVLKASSPPPLPASDIRGELMKRGYEIGQHNDAMAFVDFCLRRLEAEDKLKSSPGKVKSLGQHDGPTLWEWER